MLAFVVDVNDLARISEAVCLLLEALAAEVPNLNLFQSLIRTLIGGFGRKARPTPLQ